MIGARAHRGRLSIRVAAAFWVLTLGACLKRPIDFGRDGAPQNTEELIRRIDLAERSVSSLTGEAKLFVDTPQGKVSVSLLLSASEPAFIRLEQLDFFGRPQSLLVSNGERFAFYDVVNEHTVRGRPTRANLERVLPLSISAEELVSLLLGRVPRIHGAMAEMSFDERLGEFVVVLKQAGVGQTLRVALPHYRIVSSVMTGSDSYEVSRSDVELVQGLWLPRHTTVKATASKTRIELTYKDVTVNEQIDVSQFDVQQVVGGTVEDLDAHGDREEPN